MELHRSDRASITARATLMMRVLELDRPPSRRIVSDEVAPYFLPSAARRALAPAVYLAPPRHALERTPLIAFTTSVLCRHAFIDAHLLEALPEVDQVVVLGAGYDSRAYRFAREIGGRPVFEVDLAPLSRRKAALVEARRDVFGDAVVRRVEIDFRTQSLRDRLAECGFVVGARTFVVWEGVVPYLTREAVDETLADLAAVCGPGSTVTIDVWHSLEGGGLWPRVRRAAESSLRLIGEPVDLMLPAAEIPGLLTPHGFAPVDLVGAEEIARRHSTDGRPCDPGIHLVAARSS
ncbi:methyltransferase, TIGR00027 family [Aeromicrobium marinum DSM 15272]|uniref:S-adenosyl-L-methionine-dependent methyltransferase n=1 Tax=Aeromicrobium marinum DSM 15272 TaxID=585531 RepID=E2SDN7_9ACTN|nr:SAM-dependent methyltransferase [Aeromicrobium marinum]EFQ82614.1 methyltransferase, TIGR00027 family [Aeromicrobium marinum DSM 15272]